MQSSLVMLENADNRAPDDYMERVFQYFPTEWAALTIDLKTAGNDSLNEMKPPATMADINKVREVCTNPNIPIAYWFCNSDKKVHPDSMQPFVIIKAAEGEPLVVALAAGEFKAYQPAGGGDISGAYYYATDYLTSQFETFMELAGNDIEKLDAVLDRKNIIKNLQHSLGDGDFIIIALADEKGSVQAFSKTSVSEFDWGFTSDSLGWEKQEPPFDTTDTKAEEDIGKGLSGLDRRLAAKNAKDSANLTHTQTSTAPKSTTTFVPRNSAPTMIGTGTQNKDELSPPKGATIETHPQWFYQLNPESAKSMKQKQRARAYQEALGYTPPDYMDCPIVQRKKPKNVSTEPLKDFTGLVNIQNVAPANSLVKGEGPPIITAQSLKHINEEILPIYYDIDKRIIKSPWKAPEVEAKMAMFSDVTGLGDALYWAPVQLRKDLLTNPDALVNWTIEMSAKIIEQRKEINDLRAKLAESSARLLKSG